MNNGLGRTPQMGILSSYERDHRLFLFKGWEGWNYLGCGFTEEVVQKTADSLIDTGLAARGYKYGLFID